MVKDVAMAILSHINLEHIEITSLHQWLEGDLWEASIASCLVSLPSLPFQHLYICRVVAALDVKRIVCKKNVNSL